MEQKIPELMSKIKKDSGGHIVYLTEQTQLYIDNVVVFILDGLKTRDHVVIVENKRLTPLIWKRISPLMSEEELANVYFFDSFTLYWKKGDFLPNTIVEYLQEKFDISTFGEQGFRTWGHIEWSTQDDLEDELVLYEQKVDRLITDYKLIAVCAYDAKRVASHLQNQLGLYHDYLMKDNQIISL
ncbi:MEDS domain-containing protein [Planococcus plakortidis]